MAETNDWGPYAEAWIEAIQQGHLDNWLKKIAKAAFNRAQELGQVKDSKEVPTPASTGFPIPPMTDDEASQFAGAIINFNGHKYRRADLVGKKFVIQPGTYKNANYNGMTAEIIGGGDKSLKVKFPKPNGATAFDDTAFIWLDKVPYLFAGSENDK